MDCSFLGFVWPRPIDLRTARVAISLVTLDVYPNAHEMAIKSAYRAGNCVAKETITTPCYDSTPLDVQKTLSITSEHVSVIIL